MRKIFTKIIIFVLVTVFLFSDGLLVCVGTIGRAAICTTTVEEDATGPIMTEFCIEENGETLTVGDTFHVTAKWEDISGVKEVTAFWYGPSSGSGGIFSFTYNEEKQVWECDHTFSESEISGEYYVGSIWAYDEWGNRSENYFPDDKVYFEKNGHFLIKHSSKEATCTEPGWQAYQTCQYCDYTTYKEIAAKGHTEKTLAGKTATCTETGLTEGKQCSVCKTITVKQETIAKVPHRYNTIITKTATSKEDGEIVKKCDCGNIGSIQTIYKASKIQLSAASYTYDGKTKSPKITIKDSKGNPLKKDVDYTVKYAKGRKKVGKYAVTVTFKGNYTGTKKLYFSIVPKAVTGVEATQTTSSVTLTWSKVSGATGYRVYRYDTANKKWVTIKSRVTGNTFTVKNLKAGKKYTFAVKPCQTVNGTIFWAQEITKIKTATRTKTPSITKLTANKRKVNFTWSDVSGETGYQVYYSTKKGSGYKKLGSFKADIVKGSKDKLTIGKTYYFKVRTYIKTDSGYVYSAWSAVKSIRIPEDYSAVINEYKRAVAGDENYNYKYVDPWWLQVLGGDASKYYYAYYDINSDGVDELIVRVKTEYRSAIINVFTYKKKPVPLFGLDAYFGERVSMEIYTNGIIRVYGGNSASESIVKYYKLPSKGTELKFIEGYIIESYDSVKYCQIDGALVSKQYFKSRQDYLESGIIKPTWVKIPKAKSHGV